MDWHTICCPMVVHQQEGGRGSASNVWAQFKKKKKKEAKWEMELENREFLPLVYWCLVDNYLSRKF